MLSYEKEKRKYTYKLMCANCLALYSGVSTVMSKWIQYDFISYLCVLIYHSVGLKKALPL